MKKYKRISILILAIFSLLCFSACEKGTKTSNNPNVATTWTNPGDSLGGGQTLDETIISSDNSTIISSIENVNSSYSNLSSISSEIPSDAIYYIGCEDQFEAMQLISLYGIPSEEQEPNIYNTSDSGCISITAGGSYVFYGTYNIETNFLYIDHLTEPVVLYFYGIDVNINNLESSLIVAETSFTLVLLESNTITLTSSQIDDNAVVDQSNEFSLVGLGEYEDIDVTICGSGSLDVSLTGIEGIVVDGTVSFLGGEISMTVDSFAIKASEVIILNANLSISSSENAIEANKIYVSNSGLTINSEAYGIVSNANIDDLISGNEYQFSYNTGYVIFDNSSISITSQGTGVYSESFVYISGGEIEITANSADVGSSSGIVVSQVLIGENVYLDGDYTILIDDGDITINSQMNGIDACDYLLVTGGNVDLQSKGYGIYAKGLVQLNGTQANIQIQNSTNGIYAEKIEILDGNLSVSATNSGVISETSILIEGGEVILYGSSKTTYATIDSGDGIVVNGGTFVACGPLGKVETPCTNSSANIISFASENAISAGSEISILDAEGNTISEIVLEYDCHSIIFSSEELLVGSTYNVTKENEVLISFTIEENMTIVSLPA